MRSFENARINLEFSGIPDDVEVEIDAWVTTLENLEDDGPVDQALNQVLPVSDTNIADLTNDQLSIDAVGNLVATITAEGNEASIFTEQLMAMNDGTTDDVDETHTGGMLTPTGRDVVIVLGRIDLGATDAAVDALLPLNLDIQVTVDVGSIGTVKSTGTPPPAIPRFASDKTTAVTVIESTSAQTTMEVAYVLSDGTFDTGIAVSNMTKDQAGAVHFTFYMNGEEVSYSTDMIMPRSTMSILLSQVLTAAGHSGSFSGQMIITADFTEADAGVFISDFSGFTSAAAVRKD